MHDLGAGALREADEAQVAASDRGGQIWLLAGEERADTLAERIDWTNAWAKKYPILAKYQGEVNVALYARRIRAMLDEIRVEYGYSELDAMLALKGILYQVWKRAKATGAK